MDNKKNVMDENSISRTLVLLVFLCFVFLALATYAFAQWDLVKCQLTAMEVQYERAEQKNAHLMQLLNESEMTPQMIEQFAPYKR